MVQDDVKENIKNTYTRFIRVRVLAWIVSSIIVILTGRMFYLQVIRGAYYKKLADTNCVNIVKARAPRGCIYDRNYKPLVVNKPSFAVSVIPYYFMQNKDMEKAIAGLAAILDEEPQDIKDRLAQTRDYKLEPITLKRDLSEKELSLLAEKSIEISGLTVEQEPVRSYDLGSTASHILGYVGEINEEQLKGGRYPDYAAGDIIGQTGVENFYDRDLRGDDGVMYILTDAHGKQKEIMQTVPPKQGKNLVLTIDCRLQKFAEGLLEKTGFAGAIVASDPKTGEILCMVSKPDYNLKYFSGSVDTKEWKQLLRDKKNPLNNRAIQGLYSPGSIFKVTVGLGAINEKVIDTKTSFLCEGIYWIKTWPYKCWKRAGHGWVDFYKGVAESCDIYFYKVGLKMKVELLHKYAEMFGLGEKTGIDLPGEKAGMVPDREWKMRVDRSPWFPGNTVMMAIGQGYITATPLQIMDIMAAMANSGYVMQPHIVKAITNDNRRILQLIEPKKLLELKATPENIDIMRNALRLVMSSGRGTGKKGRVEGIQMAGKTGTVENPQGETHAMFAGFAPYADPQIVVYVLAEHAGGGGEVAAPVASDLIEYYLKVIKGK
jgi:penicillin-binding protein 2